MMKRFFIAAATAAQPLRRHRDRQFFDSPAMRHAKIHGGDCGATRQGTDDIRLCRRRESMHGHWPEEVSVAIGNIQSARQDGASRPPSFRGCVSRGKFCGNPLNRCKLDLQIYLDLPPIHPWQEPINRKKVW